MRHTKEWADKPSEQTELQRRHYPPKKPRPQPGCPAKQRLKRRSRQMETQTQRDSWKPHWIFSRVYGLHAHQPGQVAQPGG